MREKKSIKIEVHVGVLIFSGGNLLLLKRSEKRSIYPNLWESAGGQVFSGESFLDAALRIALQETGLNVDVEGIVGTYTIPASDNNKNQIIPGLRFIAEARNTLNLCLSEQHVEYASVNLKEMQKYQLIPTLDQDIEKAFVMHENANGQHVVKPLLR